MDKFMVIMEWLNNGVKDMAIFALIISVLYVLREIARIVIAFRSDTKYETTETRTMNTFVAISLIITILIAL